METNPIDWKRIRKELAGRRTKLFDRFLKNPQDIHLAIEIKQLDDEMLDCSEHLSDRRRSVY